MKNTNNKNVSAPIRAGICFLAFAQWLTKEAETIKLNARICKLLMWLSFDIYISYQLHFSLYNWMEF
jgi:hypothetical protein